MVDGSRETKIGLRSPVAAIRLDDLSEAVQIARVLTEGGAIVLEFTLTNREQ